MKVLVVYGGYGLSPEAEVSERSGEAVVRWMKTTPNEVEGFVLNNDNLPELLQKVLVVDFVIPVLHGHFGESGHIQQILEDAQVEFLGSRVDASELCWDKFRYKQFLNENNILVPQGGRISALTELNQIPMPFVLKSNKGGSSIGVWIVRDLDDLQHLKEEELLSSGDLIWEEFIEGHEITVGVFRDEVLPVVEIIPPEEAWFDYENKYNGKTTEALPPINILDSLQKQAQELALVIHNLCGCRDLTRTDMIVKGEKIYVLETNTMPGMTEESLFPKMILATGRTMEDFAKEIFNGQST